MRDVIEFEKEFKEFDFDFFVELNKILGPFFEVTQMLCGSKYPSMGLVVSAISTIEDIMALINVTNPIVNRVKNTLIDEIEGRYQSYSDIQIAGLFFDIRFKFENLPKYLDYSLTISRLKIFLNSMEGKADDIAEEKTPNVHATLKSRMFRSHGSVAKSIDQEIDSYLNIPASSDEMIDVLGWWNLNKSQFPKLSTWAECILSCQATSVPSERIFSKSGQLITNRRNALNDNTIESLICLNSWL